MDLKTLQKYHEPLKEAHGYLDGEILGVAESLKDPALTQKLSIELQKIEEASKEAATSSLRKGDKQGLVDAGRNRLSMTQGLVDQYPQLKEALLARQGQIILSDFEKTDQRTGLKTQDRSAMYVSPDGPAISINPEDLPAKFSGAGNAQFKISEYEANVMMLDMQYKNFERDLGLSPAVSATSLNAKQTQPNQQKVAPVVLEMQP